MKKIAVIIALLLLVTAFAGCVGQGDGTPTKPVIPTLEESSTEAPEESPVESPVESEDPDASESETDETEPESETGGEGVVELPRHEF